MAIVQASSYLSIGDKESQTISPFAISLRTTRKFSSVMEQYNTLSFYQILTKIAICIGYKTLGSFILCLTELVHDILRTQI